MSTHTDWRSAKTDRRRITAQLGGVGSKIASCRQRLDKAERQIRLDLELMDQLLAEQRELRAAYDAALEAEAFGLHKEDRA